MSEYIYLVYKIKHFCLGSYEELDKAFTHSLLAYEYRDMKNENKNSYPRIIKKKKISGMEVF